MKCNLCGDEVYGFGVLLRRINYAACYPCVDGLVENEIEDRGVREEARRFAEYHGGDATPEDRERQQLKDAGRTR